ncbi:hypothetical protein FGF1_36410 [Flavobacteriaceae bacterium GF1]
MEALVGYMDNGLTIASILLLTYSCTEPFEFEAEAFENVLIIDASITDEVKTQEVFLSRSFVSDETAVQESGAMVSIRDDMGVEYQFQEAEPGLYRSTIDFGAVEGRDYSLQVRTNDGDAYSSSMVTLPPKAEMAELEVVRTTNESGIDGVAILANGMGPAGEVGYYRYEYEETYRIVSPFITFAELVVVSEDPPLLELNQIDREQRICYNTVVSNVIAITDTEGFSENRVSDFQVRFIPQNDEIIASRYSILVKQHTQSREAHVFYETLREFSGIENLFTQTQPGFINGNISPDNDSGERALGFFEVTSVTSQRVFFSFEDIFPNEVPFAPFCEIRTIDSRDPSLFNLITSNRWRFLSILPTDSDVILIYEIAPARCVDCSVFNTTVVPNFWED